MIILLSPAKIQSFSAQPILSTYTQPVFLKEAEELIGHMRELSLNELSKLLKINQKIARLTQDRLLQWQQPFTLVNARQAACLFNGEAFRGLNAAAFSEEDFAFAQDHLRILSGLYGVLRPLDLIQPYRLEVSSRLNNDAGQDLYPYWRERVSKWIAGDLQHGDPKQVVLNLASNEYFKMIDFPTGTVCVEVEFLEYGAEALRQVVVYTKKARGMLAAYAIKNRVSSTDDLAGFDYEGYWYDPTLSTDSKMVFVR